MKTAFFVVPDGIDDPARPSGGNVYDRRAGEGLAPHGWSVVEKKVAGCWPCPDAPALALFAKLVSELPDDALVIVDGLIASAADQVLVPAARRLRLVVLVHLPLGIAAASGETEGAEAAVLGAARAVIVTSTWTRDQLRTLYDLGSQVVHVAEPGVEPAEPANATAAGGRLLCVAAVQPHKGHDVLLAALSQIADLEWSCECVGALDRDPAFVERLRRTVSDGGLDNRIQFVGPRTGTLLIDHYSTADLFVLASRGETYGMVVTEALARGIPVIATDVGGVSAALGHDDTGRRPGLLVPPADPDALAAALRSWLGDGGLRQQLRVAAARRRESLSGWSRTAEQVSRVLSGVVG